MNKIDKSLCTYKTRKHCSFSYVTFTVMIVYYTSTILRIHTRLQLAKTFRAWFLEYCLISVFILVVWTVLSTVKVVYAVVLSGARVTVRSRVFDDATDVVLRTCDERTVWAAETRRGTRRSTSLARQHPWRQTHDSRRQTTTTSAGQL